jgi:hypothetical protein
MFGKLGKIIIGVKALVHQFHQADSTASDLERWETLLKQLENYPNAYNKLNFEIQFVRTFTHYLEQHYPEDTRLDPLRKINAARKDSIWGFKIGRPGSKE